MNEPASPHGIGLAISGGGIRAAAIGLGALQVAEEEDVFRRARFVSSVSGGSYIATAFTAARAISTTDPTHEAAAPQGGVVPWGRRSAEEEHLRRRLRYLGEDWPDVAIALVQYLFGLLLNLLPFVASAYLAVWVLGGVFDQTDVLRTSSRGTWSAHFHWLRFGLAASALVVAVAIDRMSLGERDQERSGWGDRLAIVLRWIALWVFVACLLPELVIAYWRLSDDYPVGAAWTWVLAVMGVVVTAWAVFRSQWRVRLSWYDTAGLLVLRSLLVLLTAGAGMFALSWSLQEVVAADQVALNRLAIVAMALCVGFGFFVHANKTSLHGLYRKRLDRAFVALIDDLGRGSPRHLSTLPFENLSVAGVPELLVCAAVNLSGRETAQGVGCESFTFSATSVGGEVVGSCDTRVFGDAISGGLDCATVIATSGAAIAPNMGVFTRRALRSVLCVFNLRLGMWLPNPGHPGRSRLTEARWPWRGWDEPGPLYSWRELSGFLSKRFPFIFVSDGGHWDNSGVVELLRRRCQYVFMVDAGVDAARLGNLLRVVSLARVELGVECSLDASLLDSAEPVLRVPFTYPESQASDAHNYLIVMRSHISQKMPPDLVAEARGPSLFPRHSTANQFLRARDFDNYVALGRWLFGEGISVAKLPMP